MKDLQKLSDILNEIKTGTLSVECGETQILELFNDLLKDLPQDFYTKFVEKQVKECGGNIIGNIDAQFYFARGFITTIELLKLIILKK